MRIFKTYVLPILFVGLLVGIDQFTKFLVVQNMDFRQEIVLIDGFFSLLYTRNPGMAFGLLANFEWARWLFIILTVFILAFLIYYYTTTPKGKAGRLFRISILTLIGGALGNFIDRLFHGEVVDFFFISLINFPVFNVADIFVVVSVFGLLILTIFTKEEKWKK